MSSFICNLRLAVRTLAHRPGFSFVAIATLAIGIGANTLMLSVAHGILLQPLPYPEPDRLVNVFRLAEDVTGMNPSNDWIVDLYSVPHALYLDWAELSPVFEDIGAYAGGTYVVSGGDQPERLMGMRTTSGVFSVLGVAPELGRAFTPDDDRAGAAAQAVLSQALWQRRFGASATVLGEQIVLNGMPYTVVGVMPAGFSFPNEGQDVWVTLGDGLKQETFRAGGNMQVIARLRPGIEGQRAQTEMDAVAANLGELYPEESEHGVRVVGRQELVVAGTRPILTLFLGALSLVLLVVCANIAGLLLVRSVERRDELAVRAALGAGGSRLVGHVLGESVVLSVVGGVGGCLLAVAALQPFLGFFPGGLRRSGELGLDYRLPLIAALLSLFVGLSIGLLPALRAAHAAHSGALQSARGASAGASRGRAQSVLVVAQVAMAFALLVGGGVFFKSLTRLTSDELGFDAENIITVRIVLPDPYSEPTDRSAEFFRDFDERLAAIPGVQTVGRISQAPFSGGMSFPPTFVETDGEPISVSIHSSSVTPGYFEAMAIALRSGRLLAESDRAGTLPVAVVNETFVRTYWPDGDPIGRRVKLNLDGDFPWHTVVGVVSDVRYRYGREPFPEFYVPYNQDAVYYQAFAIKTAVDPLAVMPAARAALREIDPDVFASFAVFEETIRSSPSLAAPRFGAVAIGSLAVVAAVLAMLGIYGVLASAVAQRTREIGIRIALGAQAGRVVRGVLQRGAWLATAGLVLGCVIAWVGARFIESQLYATSPTDAATMAVAAILLGAAALSASYIPARRATRVDPVEALRRD